MFSRQELGAQFRAFSLAIGIHILMAALVVLSTMKWEPFRKPQNLGLTIEAVIVDTSEIRKQREEAKKAVEREDLRRQRDERLEQQKKREAEQKIQKDRGSETAARKGTRGAAQARCTGQTAKAPDGAGAESGKMSA